MELFRFVFLQPEKWINYFPDFLISQMVLGEVS